MVREFNTPQQFALILGGSSGLGLAAARKLAEHGMGLFLVYRNTRSEMKEIERSFDAIKATGIPFHAFNIDVCDKVKRDALITFAKQENISFRCVLHSIAKGSLKPMVDAEQVLGAEDIEITMQYMAYSLLDWITALHVAKVLAKDTRVIAFTSEGSKRAWPNYAAVASAKAAMEAIVRNMAIEFAPHGIRTNCIQAGITITASMKRIPGSDKLEAFTKERNPFKRMTTPEDVAAVVYLLCKEEAAWINGSIIPVDGGEHIA